MISSLVEDIYSQVNKQERWFDGPVSQQYGEDVAGRIARHFDVPSPPTLRLSKMGPTCPKALWHSIHTPGQVELLPPWAKIKYAYGHMIEALTIALAKASGHHVCGEQDELRVDGIVGHRDCVIDGCIVDVKSSSSPGMAKFRSRNMEEDDTFGYLDQLDGYLIGSLDDPLVSVKDKAYILAVDKTLGHMVLYEHKSTPSRQARFIERIRTYKDIVGQSRPPGCTCEVTPEGKSGNIRLGLKASYSPYKFSCFPNLRVFLPKSSDNKFSSKAPMYLTKVVRVPDMLEIDRNGSPIRNF